jgi:hypothetical protein
MIHVACRSVVVMAVAALGSAFLPTAAAAPVGTSMRVSSMMSMPSIFRFGFGRGVGMNSYSLMLGRNNPYMGMLGQPLMMPVVPPLPMLPPPMPLPPLRPYADAAGYSSPEMRSYSRPDSPGYDRSSISTSREENTTVADLNGRLAGMRRVGGGLAWPIALRYMLRDNEAAKELGERMDSRFEQILTGKAGAAATAASLQKLRDDAQKVQKRFARLGDDFPMTGAQEKDARRFLKNLLDATLPETKSRVSTPVR